MKNDYVTVSVNYTEPKLKKAIDKMNAANAE